jgi:hypothetical protein
VGLHPADAIVREAAPIEHIEDSQHLDVGAREEHVSRHVVQRLHLPVVTHRRVADRTRRHLAWPQLDVQLLGQSGRL